MKKQFLYLLLWIYLAFTAGLISSCSSQSPATRYANEHRGREFISWDVENKKDKKAQNSKVKEHTKNKHTW